jgi:acylphosphatase
MNLKSMTYHIFVSGRVQGVGYRRFAQKSAEAMGLCGWTRNLWDGRVEVMACGSEQQLDDYCDKLKQGPAFSKVQDVVVKIVSEMSAQQSFQILPDAEMG